MEVVFDGVGVSIEGSRILDDVSIGVASGEVMGLVGPNGSGKSTLLRTLYRALQPAGAVRVGGDDVWQQLSSREAARRTAAVTQESAAEFDFTVYDVAAMGRAPHKRLLERDTVDDRDLIEQSLDRVGMAGFEERLVSTLSGGERQRVLLARALVQQAPVLVLDEPTNHLDIGAQLELLHLMGQLPMSIICALHDLDLAAGHCDRVTVLQAGRVVASGPVDEVLTADLIASVFGVRAWVGHDERLQRRTIVFDRLPDTISASAPIPHQTNGSR